MNLLYYTWDSCIASGMQRCLAVGGSGVTIQSTDKEGNVHKLSEWPKPFIFALVNMDSEACRLTLGCQCVSICCSSFMCFSYHHYITNENIQIVIFSWVCEVNECLCYRHELLPTAPSGWSHSQSINRICVSDLWDNSNKKGCHLSEFHQVRSRWLSLISHDEYLRVTHVYICAMCSEHLPGAYLENAFISDKH